MKTFKPKSISKLVDEYKMPFGRHKGKPLHKISKNYLEWVTEWDNFTRFNKLDTIVMKAYLQAYRAFRLDIPKHIPKTQITKYIMAKRENNQKEAKKKENEYLEGVEVMRGLEEEAMRFDH